MPKVCKLANSTMKKRILFTFQIRKCSHIYYIFIDNQKLTSVIVYTIYIGMFKC